MVKKIFIITGEVSGDILASKIINYLDLKMINVKGIVGSNLKEMGIEGPFENKDITFFGIIDVLKNIFYIKKRIDQTVKYIESFEPDIVFSVDSPDFVFQVIKKIKQRKKTKSKFFHFVAPSIWAWREGRAKKIKNLLDKIYLLFEFEKKYFDKYGIKNQYVGHPFFENFTSSKFNINAESKLISFCPGSRKKEIDAFMPIFIDVIKNYKNTFNYHFAITKETESLVRKYLKNINNVKYYINVNENLKEKYLKNSLITVAKSGTISLDLCKNQIPYITIYRLSWMNYFIIKPFIKAKYVNIINIIADKEIIPELIQFDCNSKMIIAKLDYFFNNNDKLKALVENYNFVLKELSNRDTSKQIADDLIYNLD